MKTRSTFLLSLIVLLALILSACAPAATEAPAAEPEEAEVQEEAPPAAADEEYIYVSAMGNLEFFNAHKYGWEWGGEALGVTATYVGPAEYDMNAMVAAFDQAIAKQPKGICVFAVEAILQPQIDKATDAGIPVATILGDLPESKRIAYVGSYQRDLGYMGGMGVAEALGGSGKIAILSIPGVQMFDDREAGYREAFDKFPGIEVVQVGDTKADTVTAVNVAKDILTANPDLAAFVGTDSTAGIGAATAVEEAGLVGKVKVVAMDRNSDILQKIKEGTLTATVAQDDAAMAFWCLQVLYNFNHNQAPLTSDNEAAGVTTGPTNVFMWANYVDESNVDYFLAANETYAK